MNWLTTVALGAAITVVFVLGSIFRKIRSAGPTLWQEFASCGLCVGVWVGIGVRLILEGLPETPAEAVILLGIACATGVAALAIASWLSK